MASWLGRMLIVVATLPLGGCVAGLAASAVGMAAQSAAPERKSNEGLRPDALAACSARAAQYGTPRIIDSEQRAIDKIVVWGSVGEGEARRSFECSYNTAITGFKLRKVRQKY